MKHKFIWVLTATLLFSTTACSSDKKTADDTAKNEATATVSSTPTEAPKTKVTSQYGEVSLGDYKNLQEEKLIYTVTDEDVQNEISSLIEDFIKQKEVKRKSKEGDTVTINFVGTCDGQIIYDYEEEEVDLLIGDNILGKQFDKKITGVSAGDTPNFTVNYPESYEDEDLAGLTVQYRVTIKKVSEEEVPELTDAFVKKNLDYDSYDDMKTKIKEELESDNVAQSENDLRESLLNQVIQASTVEKYTDELYASCKKTQEEEYQYSADVFGFDTVEEYYDQNDLTEDKREEELLDFVYRTIIIDAIGVQEGLTVTDEEYKKALKQYVEESGAENEKEFLEVYSENDIKGWILEEKVLNFLEKNATVTEKEGTADSQD
ncbi:MAG: FKBP-type peptidyl-prolyl cis-trans isomerase [bacterium]|nr:FKBP-type peptidyl-prolyl cis-trans isomerase [bacterium]